MKKPGKILLSFALSAVLCAQPFVYPVYAQEQAGEDALGKIDVSLLARLEGMGDTDSVDVSVWMTDIDDKKVQEKTEQALAKKCRSGEVSGNVMTLSKTERAVKADTGASARLSAETDVQALAAVSSEEAQVFLETKRAAASAEYREYNSQIFESLFPKERQGLFRTVAQTQPEILYACHYAPDIVMTLTKAQVYQVVQSSAVEAVYDAQPPQDSVPALIEDGPQSLTKKAAAANNISLTYQTITGVSDMRVYNHASGSGVKVGQIELSAPNPNHAVFSHMVDSAHPENSRFHILMNQNPDRNNDHATTVACILVGKSSGYTGIVPDADYYAVGVIDKAGKHHWREGMELLLDAGVNVINASYEFAGEPRGAYGEPSKWIDHVINEHDVSVCISAGNDTEILGGAMAYNAITVGNIDDKHTMSLNDDARQVNKDDPSKQSAYSLNTKLAYKPDIMAPGDTAGTPLDPQSSGEGHGGTSYSAPIVTGAVAQLCGRFPAYKAMPLVLKAALLAGAVKTQEMIDCDEDVDPDNDIDSVVRGARIALDRKNGAGMVNVLRAYSVINDGTWFYHPSFGKNSKMQPVNVSLESGKRIQICLVWPKQNVIHGPHYPADGTNDPPTPVYDVAKETLLLSVNDGRPVSVYESFYQYDTKEYISFEPRNAGQVGLTVTKISNPYVTGVPMVLAWYQQ